MESDIFLMVIKQIQLRIKVGELGGKTLSFLEPASDLEKKVLCRAIKRTCK